MIYENPVATEYCEILRVFLSTVFDILPTILPVGFQPTIDNHDLKLKVKVQVFYSLISSLKNYHRTLHFPPMVTGPVHSCAISTPRGAYSPAAVSAY